MTDLERGPPDVEESWENGVVGVLPSLGTLEILIDGDVAAEYQNQSKNIPRCSLT
jgi:hypothetical protein